MLCLFLASHNVHTHLSLLQTHLCTNVCVTIYTSIAEPPPKSIRSYFDEDLPYVMDAKTSGNLGRYLNVSAQMRSSFLLIFVVFL